MVREMTLGRLVVQNVGLRRSYRVWRLVAFWAGFEALKGRPAGRNEVQHAFEDVSAATFSRDLSLFREAVGGKFDSPSDLFVAAGAAERLYGGDVPDVAQVMLWAVPA